MTGKFVLKTSGDGFMFTLHAANGEVMLTSQRYGSREAALRGVAAVQAQAGDDARYEAGGSGLHFNLKAANGEVIGSSETYSTPAAAREGMQAVRHAATGAEVEDRT